MKWSVCLGRFAGIPIYLHATFALLLGWIGIVHWTASGTVGAVVSGIVFIVALFACVLLHELGHALAARRFAIRTRDITLLPIGGLAETALAYRLGGMAVAFLVYFALRRNILYGMFAGIGAFILLSLARGEGFLAF